MVRLVYDAPESIEKLKDFTRKHIEMGESNSHILDQAKYHPNFYMSMTAVKIKEVVNEVLKEQGRL